MILVVEDNRHIRLAMTTFLKMKGYEVEQADTLQAATALIEQGGISLIITDLNLPDGKGDELLGRTKTPIIAMTGQVDEASKQRIRESGFAAFLPKPASLDQILEAVEQVMRVA